MWVDISGQSKQLKVMMTMSNERPVGYPGGALLFDVRPRPGHGLVGAHRLHHRVTLRTDLGPVGHVTFLLT